jgi:hypothetical protein
MTYHAPESDERFYQGLRRRYWTPEFDDGAAATAVVYRREIEATAWDPHLFLNPMEGRARLVRSAQAAGQIGLHRWVGA